MLDIGWKVGGFEGRALAEQDRPFHQITQLTNVAGEAVLTQEGLCALSQSTHRFLERKRRTHEKLLGQGNDLVASFAERRDGQGHHVKSIVEILAKLALCDRLFEVAIRRRHEPDIHRDGGRSSDAAQRPLFQHSEELGLQ